MRKLAVLGVLLSMLCAWPSAVKAQGIQAGDQLVSGYAGFGVPLQESGIYYTGTELDWGDVGASYGISYLFFPSEYFGIGAELSGSHFFESEFEYTSWSPFREDTVKSSMNMFNFMAAFRANVNPHSNVRFYVPFGAGLTSAKGEIEVESSSYPGTYTLDGTSNSFGYFIGLGMEADLRNNWMLGGEVRFNGFRFDTGKYDLQGVSGKKDYTYLSFLFKVGYKF